KLRIINCYLPPGNFALRNVIQLDLIKYIREATSNNYLIVLLGNFNADMDNPKLHSQDKNLFSMLNNAHLFDTFTVKYNQLRVAHPTHRSTKSNSRIDFIWSSGDVISNFTHCDTEDVLPFISDHSIVILKIDNFLAAK
ncbi:5011_t:CDS:1, partial [Funneliformis geosporum]